MKETTPMCAKILLDGSNILFWQGGVAHVDLPARVISALGARRFHPDVYFDHSIWRYVPEERLDELRDLAQVTVVPRGTSADTALLNACNQGRIQIVSNDRFRAWRGQYPKLRKEWLVTGSVGKGGRIGFSKTLRPAPL